MKHRINLIKDKGGGIVWLRHKLRKQRCLSNLLLDGDWIKCAKCGTKLGFVYWVNGEYRFLLFPQYRKFTEPVEKFVSKTTRDRHEPLSESDQIFNDMIKEIREEMSHINDESTYDQED